MLEYHDLEFVEYLKNLDEVNIDVVNDIKMAYLLKINDIEKRYAILKHFPQTKKVKEEISSKVNELYYWLTLVGYWFFKKLQESLSGFEYDLPETIPSFVNMTIINKLKVTILNNNSKVIDIILEDNDIWVVNEAKEIINLPDYYAEISKGYLNKTEPKIVNQILNDNNSNQRLKDSQDGLSEGKYANENGDRIYLKRRMCLKPGHSFFQIARVLIVNDIEPVKMFEITPEGKVIEDKDYTSLVNNKRRKQIQIRKKTIN